MAIDIDSLIASQQKFLESIEPVDVEVALGDRVVTVRVPFLMPREFNEISCPLPRPADSQSGAWFNLADVTRSYPGVSLIDGDEVDELYVLRDREALYRWPEVYDALDLESRRNVEAAVWGLHVYAPQQRRKEVKENADGI